MMSILLWLGMFSACSTDDDKIDSSLPKVQNKIGEVKDLTGVMHYDQNYQVWYISVDNNGGPDASIQRLDILHNIDSAFKQEGLPVLFSGETLQWIDGAEGDPLNSGNLVIIISNIINVD